MARARALRIAGVALAIVIVGLAAWWLMSGSAGEADADARARVRNEELLRESAQIEAASPTRPAEPVPETPAQPLPATRQPVKGQ